MADVRHGLPRARHLGDLMLGISKACAATWLQSITRRATDYRGELLSIFSGDWMTGGRFLRRGIYGQTRPYLPSLPKHS